MATPYTNKIRPRPNTNASHRFAMCTFYSTRGGCRRGDNCTFAHSDEELKQWNSFSAMAQVKKESNTSHRIQRLPSDQMREPLTTENYKTKFIQLVEAEREEHRGQLKQRCTGQYQYHSLGLQCPRDVINKSGTHYAMYGRLDGLNQEDFAYVKQASSSVTLESQYTADILDRRQHSNSMFLGFLQSESKLSSNFPVTVQFNLKESYFHNLLLSIDKLRIVPRLVPDSCVPINEVQKIEEVKKIDSICGEYCSEEQLEALKIMVNCAPTNPPILLTGAFGTGKSRLLAISALYFLSKATESSPIRILLCTQQRLSADKFLDYYKRISWESKNSNVFVIREYGYNSLEADSKKYYMSSEQFKDFYKKNKSKSLSLLVITTCLTAPHLMFLPAGYFNHIFIDEGSHMREPEAVAPLYFASTKTKIIIAGDVNQVGPVNLVRGQVARSNSLNISLLQRLERCYEPHPDWPIIARLCHNYRCHPVILELVSKLFYDSSLKWDEQESTPTTHRKHRYPLVFICSSVDDSLPLETYKIQDVEAEIIVDKVGELNKRPPSNWNTDKCMKNYLITSPCESQINTLYKKFHKREMETPEIKTMFQGQEYQVVILSTTEPVNLDGSTLDGTKSFCDPYVFNTAITRSKSLVIAVGNPFLLLKMEKCFVREYGEEHNAYCWSTYLDLCIQNDSFCFHTKLGLSEEQQSDKLEKLKATIAGTAHKTHESLEQENYRLRAERDSILEENESLKQQLQEIQTLQEEKENLMKENERLQKIEMHHQEEVQLMSQKIEDLQCQLNNRSAQLVNEETEIALENSKGTGEGVEQMPTKGGPKVMVQNDLEKVIYPHKSIEHEGKKYKMKDILGEGGFAKVYHVKEASSDDDYALKVIKCSDKISEKRRREVKALQKLKHRRIVEYVDDWSRDNDDEGWWSSNKDDGDGNNKYLFILTELCQKGTLRTWLENNVGNEKRSNQDVTSYFIQIMDGLIFIHDKDYVHRDLKPSNIFFSLDNNGLKIGDFGLVMDESSDTDRASTFRGWGTPYYMSPEQKNKERVDSKTDIYALGVILFELYYPKTLTSEDGRKVLGRLTSGNFPEKFGTAFPEIHLLINLMMLNEREHRPSAFSVKETFIKTACMSTFIPICDEQI